MNNEILKNYFTDRQIAALQGITLGGLRNKIYRKKVADLPTFIVVNSRTRLWHKEKTRTWLTERYQGDAETVNRLMKTAEETVASVPGEE
jgi:hypothetical protein